LLHVYSKEGGKPFVAHEVLDLTGKPPCTCERKQFFFLSIGKLSLSENKIYKSGHYDLIKKKKEKNSTSWDECNILNDRHVGRMENQT